MVLLVGEPSVYAQRVGWFPGDCFFPSELSDVSKTQSGILLAHTSLTDSQNVGQILSYVGFSYMCIQGDDAILDKFAVALTRSSKLLGDDSILCVYRNDFDAGKYRMLVRYNEDWFRFPDQRPTRSTIGNVWRRYSSLLHSEAGVAEDWRFSTEVDGLPATLPIGINDWALEGECISEPICCNLRDIVCYRIVNRRLESAFDKSKNAKILKIDMDANISAISWNDRGGVVSHRVKM